MEEDTTVEVTCAMRGGGRKKRKEKKGTRGTRRKKDRPQGESDERDVRRKELISFSDAEEVWMQAIKKQLQDWSKKSLENGVMRRFVEQTEQMGPGQRDEAIRGYSEALQEFPEEKREMAVSQIRWMVDEKVGEMENERMSDLIRRKNEEGYFRKGNGPDEEFDFGKHYGKSFKGSVLVGPRLLSMDIAAVAATSEKADELQIFLAANGRHHGQGRTRERKEGDWVVAKLRREVRNRLMETAKELGEEENEIVKDLIAGRVRRSRRMRRSKDGPTWKSQR